MCHPKIPLLLSQPLDAIRPSLIRFGWRGEDPYVRAGRRQGGPTLRADMAYQRRRLIGDGTAFVTGAVRVSQARQKASKRNHDCRCARCDRANLALGSDGEPSQGPYLVDHEVGHRAELHREQPGRRRGGGSAAAGENPETASLRRTAFKVAHYPHEEVGAALQRVREPPASPASNLLLLLPPSRRVEPRGSTRSLVRGRPSEARLDHTGGTHERATTYLMSRVLASVGAITPCLVAS